MVGFQTKVEGHFTAAEELKQAQARILVLDGEAVTAKASILDLQGRLTLATDGAASKDGEITKLKGEIELSKGLANKVIAAQGLHPNDVPPADATKGGIPPVTETAWQKYNRLQATDSREAGRFYADNKEKIFSTRPQ